MNLHDAWHIRLEAEREAKIKSLEKEIARLRLTDAEREAAEVARLRDVIKRAASYWIHLDPGVAWEGDIADAMAAAVAEIARLRLTDAERDLVERLAAAPGEPVAAMEVRLTPQERKTARGLLERMGDCPASDNAADRDNGHTDSE